MNKRFVAILVLGIPLSGPMATLQAMQDKPALTIAEKRALLMAKIVAACGGFAVGGYAGSSLCRCLKEGWWKMIAVALPGGACAYYGHKVVKYESVHAFALYHGVGFYIEQASQYYNVNISQYWPLFLNSISGKDNSSALKQAIGELYTERFGADWQSRMVTLFDIYGDRAEGFLKYSALSSKNDDVKDLIRMIELGAAMANLYYRTNPDQKNTINSAITLYKELGLLQ